MMPQRTLLLMLVVACLTILCLRLDGEGVTLWTPYPAVKHSACGNVFYIQYRVGGSDRRRSLFN